MIGVFQSQLIARIEAEWPTALGDTWGQQSVTAFWESLEIVEPVPVTGDWEGITGGAGVLVADLVMDSHLADPLPLLASLTAEALQEEADPATPEGGVVWDWTARPLDLRHVAAEAGIALRFRFAVDARIVRRLAPAAPVPTGVWSGFAPEVGAGQASAYEEVSDDG